MTHKARFREVFRRNQATEVGWRFVGVIGGLIGGIWLLCYVELIYVNRIHANCIVLWGSRIGSGLLIGIGFAPAFCPYTGIMMQHMAATSTMFRMPLLYHRNTR